MIGKIKKAMKIIRSRKECPLHIEFNVTDFCNLNCKGCSHYSPLAEREFQGLKSLEKSMASLSSVKNAELIDGVFLIGGETLLYPDLKEAMRMSRKYFPWARLSVFTNGLLLPKMDDDFWEVCRETKAVIALTRYPVKFDYDSVEALCRSKGVEVEVFGDRGQDDTFFKLPLDPSGKQWKWLAHLKCISFGCITIDHEKIFPCSQSACVGHLNRRCGTDFRWEEGDYIRVEDIKDARELLRLRNRPVPFCRYCRPAVPVAYGSSSRSVTEWV